MSKVFEYGGYHFVPYRKFRGKSEKDFGAVSDKLRTDWQLGMIADRRHEDYKIDYDYDDFCTASPDSSCDIYRCVENGRLYVPGLNELFGFQEKPNRERNDAR